MSGILPRRAILAGGAALALPLATRAQPSWPAQPIRLVVPFAPGGTTDLTARLIAQGLQERLGQPVIIENRPGAGATVGSLAVAQAAPDGHTLLVSNIASHAIAPSLYRGLRYDAVRDFTHIALIVENPSVLVAAPRFPAATLGDVVRLSREDARGLDIASSGSGSSNHLLIVQFGQATGARLNHVPYRGAGPAMTDTIAGVVPMMADSLPSAAAHLRGGAVRALALSAETRHPAFPSVPTFREQGVDLVSASWFGLSGPAAVPAAVTERLAGAVAALLAEPALRARFAEIGGTVGALGPSGYAAFVAAEVARWAPVVQASGAQVD
ncbi:Bug family tripartite tricarboxylate transporter substrate binding protein [Paracraurococcus lichenis]|uniref:Tripartite tricarboxylate transporter substrate binding protein n=1 Tax=Paracraurococcus lichenis TaxID=3064888 RepID=A0ABT9E0B7_9PROT|nr:tripartite tricarboxylate transporter substrate binding protein [Paracraurococcus sp. LOR1-02]MDO9709591.1 tripartite tricarboxylate transporter substrate binding protein [Paracraurococcus sp. LOR1-02]